jgi:hypothetical protein
LSNPYSQLSGAAQSGSNDTVIAEEDTPSDDVAYAAAASPLSSEQFRPYQADQWAKRYEQLANFKTTFGHCFVDPEQSKVLFHWAKHQRYQHKLKSAGRHTTLTDERQQQLDDLGFVWDSHDALWEQRFNELLAYKEENGHTNVPVQYSENEPLGVWVKSQQRHYWGYKKNPDQKKSAVKERRYKRLDEIRFQWNLRYSRHREAALERDRLEQNK